MGNSGKGLGIVALILAIGALGLGAYQIILPSPSPPEGPKIYVASNDNLVILDFSTIQYIPQLNITYDTKVGDNVILEYSCQIKLDPSGTTSISIYFNNNGSFPSSQIFLYADSAEDYQDIYSSGIMRYHFQSSTAGARTLRVSTWISEDYTNSYIRYSVLTVTVY